MRSVHTCVRSRYGSLAPGLYQLLAGVGVMIKAMARRLPNSIGMCWMAISKPHTSRFNGRPVPASTGQINIYTAVPAVGGLTHPTTTASPPSAIFSSNHHGIAAVSIICRLLRHLAPRADVQALVDVQVAVEAVQLLAPWTPAHAGGSFSTGVRQPERDSEQVPMAQTALSLSHSPQHDASVAAWRPRPRQPAAARMACQVGIHTWPVPVVRTSCIRAAERLPQNSHSNQLTVDPVEMGSCRR